MEIVTNGGFYYCTNADCSWEGQESDAKKEWTPDCQKAEYFLICPICKHPVGDD